MPRLLIALRRRLTPTPLVAVRISRAALENNYEAFRSAYRLPVAPVLKSNAYGHGLLETAQVLVARQPPFFALDAYWEARYLRRRGIRQPLLILGYTTSGTIAKNRLRGVSFALTSLDTIRALASTEARASVHIKLDTGMRRQGLLEHEIDEAMALLRQSGLKVEGVFSHFADADGVDPSFTRGQIARWQRTVPRWRDAFPTLRYWHLAATAGAAYAAEIESNVLRVGSGLYGFARQPSQTFALRPILSMHAALAGVKELKAGEVVGYNGTFTAPRDMQIATIPVGYFEGVDRRLSNAGVMLVGGVECPIIGRVSMNIAVIDVSACASPAPGDSVVVFSGIREDPNSLENAAKLCNTTPLELLVHIPQHLRRVVV